MAYGPPKLKPHHGALIRLPLAKGSAIALLLSLAPQASIVRPASGAPPESWNPVDQNVADIDPLARSLRKLGPGLRADGEHTSLFEVEYRHYEGGPVQRRRYRLGPGFRARVDRLDYLVRRGRRGLAVNEAPRKDGEWIDLPGANTVYELSPQPRIPRTRSIPTPSSLLDGRVTAPSTYRRSRSIPEPNRASLTSTSTPASDGRLDGRVDARIDGRINGRVEGRLE